jgi:NAD(P)-dependent dehydrogenase (short-subunit alcohol dehydrogenase family)
MELHRSKQRRLITDQTCPKHNPQIQKANFSKYQFVQTLSAQGDTVIATARNAADLETKIQSDALPNTHVVSADLTSYASLVAAAATSSSLVHGKIDHLIINGAYLSPTSGLNGSDFTTQPELFLSELRKSTDANVAGPLFAINAFLPLLRAGKGKRVTYISSAVADLSETLATRLSNSVPYSASKAGGTIVMAKFACELRDEGFVFLSIAPGAVATETLMETLRDTEKCEFVLFLFLLLHHFLADAERDVAAVLHVISRIPFTIFFSTEQFEADMSAI